MRSRYSGDDQRLPQATKVFVKLFTTVRQFLPRQECGKFTGAFPIAAPGRFPQTIDKMENVREC